MDEEEGLTRDGAGAAIADAAEPPLRHARPGARRLVAPAPVRDPVLAAHGVGAEAADVAATAAVGDGGAGVVVVVVRCGGAGAGYGGGDEGSGEERREEEGEEEEEA